MMRSNKVAELTIWFWIMKILATTLGETAGDHLSMTLQLGYLLSLMLCAAFFFVVVSVQLLLSEFRGYWFWLGIVGTTILGTEISDYMTRSLGLGYLAGAAILISCLIGILLVWYLRFTSLKVFPIRNLQKEIFYWLAILFSNSLGTSFGDLLGDRFGMSYLQGAMLTGMVILGVYLLHRFSRINGVILFWSAFIFTRPFGATFGDFLTKPIQKGGLGLDSLMASGISAALIILCLLLQKKQSPQTKETTVSTTTL